MMDRLLTSSVAIMFQKTALPGFDQVPSLCLPSPDLKALCEQRGISLDMAETDKSSPFITGESKVERDLMTWSPPRSSVVQETWILVFRFVLWLGILKFGDRPFVFHLPSLLHLE